MSAPSPTFNARSRWALYLDLIRWDRPAGWLVLLWPTLVALWAAADGFPGWHVLLVFVLGTICMRSAGCAINDIADRRFDLHVKRTAQRPLTTGAITVREATQVALVFMLVAFALVLSLHSIAALLWSIPAVVFTVLYPYTKRFFAIPQAFLGFAFNFGILIAYATILGSPNWQAWALWFANLLMVLAYDTEYAMVDRDDDLKIGIRTSAITLGKWDVSGVLIFYFASIAIIFAALHHDYAGIFFHLGLIAALGQILWHARLIGSRSREGCFRAFKNSHWIGASIFIGLLLQDLAQHA